MEENKLDELYSLCAKIGVFFAKSDGVYRDCEDGFLKYYLLHLSDDIKVNQDAKNKVNAALKSSYSIEEIIDESKAYLSAYSGEEREKIVEVLSVLIDKIIKVDGEEHPDELRYYEQWKEEVGKCTFRWITIPSCCYFKDIKVRPDSAKKSNVENNSLWFYENEQKEAEDFLKKLKQFVLDNYPYPNRTIWLDENWVINK